MLLYGLGLFEEVHFISVVTANLVSIVIVSADTTFALRDPIVAIPTSMSVRAVVFVAGDSVD